MKIELEIDDRLAKDLALLQEELAKIRGKNIFMMSTCPDHNLTVIVLTEAGKMDIVDAAICTEKSFEIMATEMHKRVLLEIVSATMGKN